MDRFSLSAEWIAQHKEDFEWREFLGATIATDDDITLSVCNVRGRAWPDGPILEVCFVSGPPRKNGFYTINGFASGKLKTLFPAEDHVQTLCSVYEATERVRAERMEAEKARVLLQEQARAEAVQRAQLMIGAAEREAKLLNASRQFDLLLFDLDETLLRSGYLTQYRGRENLNNRSTQYLGALRDEAKHIVPLIPESVLLEIKRIFPGLRLGVFTKAPRVYALTLLQECFPNIEWDCVTAFEDINGHTKPAPNGVYASARAAGVADISRVSVIGDEESDIAAAYQAGAHAVLYWKGWGSQWNSRGNPKRREHYRALDFIPDAKINRHEELVTLITRPSRFLPALESWGNPANQDAVKDCTLRVDTKNHFNNYDDNDRPSWVVAHALGRYFPSAHDGSRYDFGPKERHHNLTEIILRAKDGAPYPDSWATCFVAYIRNYLEVNYLSGADLIICPVPSSHFDGNGTKRLEEFLGRVEECLGDMQGIQFDISLLQFQDGVKSNRSLNQQQRFENIRDHLMVNPDQAIADKTVMVIDDVVTSGATFYYADRYLKAAGTAQVHCLAMAQTIS